MKRYMFALAALVLSHATLAAGPVIYEKKNASVEIQKHGDAVDFSINSVVGQNLCEFEGKAFMVDAHRAAYTSDDENDMCVVLLNFSNNQLTVTTKDCSIYCGLHAEGSMDGRYKKAKK